jgi:hypothetical protein
MGNHQSTVARASASHTANVVHSQPAPFARVNSHPILVLQQTIGNRAVQRLIESQFKHSEREDFNEGPGPGAIVNAALNSPGNDLEPKTRSSMEANLGSDFSRVRIHTDALAAESAAAIQANAYTSGNDIVFAEGRYSPGTTEGQRLLAHELAHVGQQGSGPVAGTPTADGSLTISDPEDAFERAADAQADRVVGNSTGEAMQPGEAAHPAGSGQGASSPGTTVQRDSIKDSYEAMKEVASDVWGVGKTMGKMADSNATKTGFWGTNPNTGQPQSAMDWGAGLGTNYDKNNNQGNPSITGGLLAAGGGIVGGIGGAVQDLFEGNDVMK